MHSAIKRFIEELTGTTPLDVLKKALLVAEFDYLDNPSPELDKKRQALFQATLKAEQAVERAEVLGSGFPAVHRNNLSKALVTLKVQGVLTDEDIQSVLN